jgi:molecular chaperone GrpE
MSKPDGQNAEEQAENACPHRRAENSEESQADGQTDGAETGAASPANGAEPSDGAADSAAEAEAPVTPEEKIASLEAQLAEARNDYLRKAADFENFRKRMNAEKQSAIDFANQALLLDIIPVIDDLERAVKAAETQREAAGDDAEKIAASYSSLHEGISMIEKRLVGQLEAKWGLKRFDSAGEQFDPNRHEAIMMEKSADAAEPVVAEDFIKGYTLKDRVVRAAKVKVTMPETNG